MSLSNKVILKRDSFGQWALYNMLREQLTSSMTFYVKADAVEWAKQWASSWPNVEVVVDE